MLWILRMQRIGRALACFSLALVMRYTQPSSVFASQSPDYGVNRSIDDIRKSATDRADQIDRHITATDDRVNDFGIKLAELRGLGEGGFGVLGVLETLGLLTPLISKKTS